MDFKKKMILDYSSKLNDILGKYKAEYIEIIQKTIQEPREGINKLSNSPSDVIPLEISKINVEEDHKIEEIQHDVQKECVHELKDNQKKDYLAENQDEANNVYELKENLNINAIEKLEENLKKEATAEIANLNVSKTQHTIEDSVFEEQTNLFDNSINIAQSSLNQSFFIGERRKARRKTGKKIIKRKLLDPEDSFIIKRMKNDKEESFLITNADQIKLYYESITEKENMMSESLIRDRKDLDQLKTENLLISKKLEQELKELKSFKETIMNEFKRLEEEKKHHVEQAEQTIMDKIKMKEIEIHDEIMKESKKLEAERTILIEDRKVFEEQRLLEQKKLEMEKVEIELEREKAMKRKEEEILELKKRNLMLEAEMKLFQKEREKILTTFEEEREKINQTLLVEKEKINQTLLEISNKPKQEASVIKSDTKSIPYEVKLPLSFKAELERKKTLNFSASNSIRDVFIKFKEHHLNKSSRASKIENDDESQFFKPVTRNFPVFDINRISPHSLYKKSIDIQSKSSDPKKYIPKTYVPFYNNEDEFESDEKKFTPAMFTKDPKLNYFVKCQSHDEIRAFFGNKTDIDVECIFSEIENISNYSPNKLKKRNSK